MIVVDASALALALLDDGPLGDTARAVLTSCDAAYVALAESLDAPWPPPTRA